MNLTLKILIFLTLSICFNLANGRTSEQLRVRIDDGRLVGRYMTSDSGKTIRAFTGIPYAAPPVGDLRFRAPQKVEPWLKKTKRLMEDPPSCTQINLFDTIPNVNPRAEVTGQEDCLYLNVYTPEITNNTKLKWPVLVFIHGGAWYLGHSTEYQPEYFLEHEVVLVTGNYRLGPMGFLSTEDEHCSGNFALKDQLMILEWVQMNIEKFNGDKRSVTIFGESAGAASVDYHLNSPMSRKLFHRAIVQSASLFNNWAQPDRKGVAKMKAIRLADKVNCTITGTSMKEMVNCLRQKSAHDIIDAQRHFQEWYNDPIVVFKPVVEESELEEEPFVADLRVTKHSLDIPLMIGLTSEEGAMKSAGILNSIQQTTELSKKWEEIIPLTFYFDHLSDDERTEMNVKIYDFYFKKDFLQTTEANLTHMWTDGWFLSGVMDGLATRLRDNNRDNTYVYLFTHKGVASISEISGGQEEKFYGTCHADDLFYLFPLYKTWTHFNNAIPSEEDKRLIKIMTKLWVNFANSDTPTPEWNKDSEFPYWTPASKFPLDYMQIGNENGNSDKLLQMKKGLYEERTAFWKNLRDEYGLRVWKTDDDKPKDEL